LRDRWRADASLYGDRERKVYRIFGTIVFLLLCCAEPDESLLQ
jgi:hypothetical protein